MIVDTEIGRFYVTALDDERVTVTADSPATLRSILDGIELTGAALSDSEPNPVYPPEAITPFPFFKTTRYRVTLSRSALVSFFNYEILNFLNYPSLHTMKGLAQK